MKKLTNMALVLLLSVGCATSIVCANESADKEEKETVTIIEVNPTENQDSQK